MRTRSIHKAALTDAVTPLEESGRRLAYKAATEGIVLLENDGCLPLKNTNSKFKPITDISFRFPTAPKENFTMKFR